MIISKIQNSTVLVPNKSFGQLLNISPKSFMFLKTFNIWSITKYFTKKNIFLKTFILEVSDIEVTFTDQNSKSLEIEDKINITLVIN